MLKVGDSAPDFELMNHENKNVSLKDFSGKNVILYFYPKDNTPGCTKESIAFSEAKSSFEEHNAVVIGVSKDSVASHKRFVEKYDLQWMLVSDPNKEVINAYGVWQEKKSFGQMLQKAKTYMGIVRSTFLINEKGDISAIWESVKVKGHVEEVLDHLISLK